MAQAPREDQLVLLEVAELDGAINRLRADDAKHPLRSDVAELMNMIASKGREITATEEELATAESALESATKESEKIVADIEPRQERLDSGEGVGPRELLSLQSEVDKLREILSDVSDREFEQLERVEELQTALEEKRNERTVLNEKLVEGRAELEREVEDISAQIADITAERDKLYGPLHEDLQAAYERAVKRGGLTVIKMYPDGSTSGGVEFSPIEVAQIKNGDPDRIHISEDYGCIVVRMETFD